MHLTGIVHVNKELKFIENSTSVAYFFLFFNYQKYKHKENWLSDRHVGLDCKVGRAPACRWFFFPPDTPLHQIDVHFSIFKYIS